jgi:putative membrane protein
MWLLKAAIFFTLFAFALNNQQDGRCISSSAPMWRAPLVLVVLAAFACGLALGALGHGAALVEKTQRPNIPSLRAAPIHVTGRPLHAHHGL